MYWSRFEGKSLLRDLNSIVNFCRPKFAASATEFGNENCLMHHNEFYITVSRLIVNLTRYCRFLAVYFTIYIHGYTLSTIPSKVLLSTAVKNGRLFMRTHAR